MNRLGDLGGKSNVFWRAGGALLLFRPLGRFVIYVRLLVEYCICLDYGVWTFRAQLTCPSWPIKLSSHGVD